MDALLRVNRSYDGVPETLRMAIVPIVLIVVGGINMALTISRGFPFALLFMLALALILAIRAPYVLGWIHGGTGDTPPHVKLHGFDWLYNLNRRYDALPEMQRFAIVPAVLILTGWLNMSLTIAGRFPFGLLFLIALLAVVFFRVPYAQGWLAEPSAPTTAAAPPA